MTPCTRSPVTASFPSPDLQHWLDFERRETKGRKYCIAPPSEVAMELYDSVYYISQTEMSALLEVKVNNGEAVHEALLPSSKESASRD